MKKSRDRNKTFKDRLFGSRTQASLFHYIKEDPDKSIWKDMDWDILIHPFRTARDAWRRPRSRTSLFRYLEQAPKRAFSWKESLRDIFTGFRKPIFISSVFTDPAALMMEKARGHIWRIEARSVSVLVHSFVFGVVFLFMNSSGESVPRLNPNVIFIDSNNANLFIPDEGTGNGGGGGGGREEQLPPQSGRLPEPVASEVMIPDPQDPHLLIPEEDLFAGVFVEMPVDIPLNTNLDIGDPTQPPNVSSSFGPGKGDGMGTGNGPGGGSGDGPGGGSGKDGGYGSGEKGGIGPGKGPYYLGDNVKEPVLLKRVNPPYTEEARIARAEGVVLLKAVIRKNGTVDNFEVVRSLGYGLDAAAIHTVAKKWRFRPASHNGETIDYPVQIEVTFTMY